MNDSLSNGINHFSRYEDVECVDEYPSEDKEYDDQKGIDSTYTNNNYKQ